MKPESTPGKSSWTFMVRIWRFPLLVLLIYGGLYIFSPLKTLEALKNCSHIAGFIAIPLGLVFAFMLLVNRFLSPGKIINFLGREAGVKSLLMSAAAGIISVGPIYAWYPLLKSLRDKGVSNAVLATFLCNRSVKPVLIPVMVSFFGWWYVLVLTFFTLLGALTVGMGVGLLTEK